MFTPPDQRKTFHGYAAPLRYRPEWITAFLVYKAGNPDLKMSSMTGGGQIYGREYRAFGKQVINDYAPGISSGVGGGQVNARPAFLAALFGGGQGVGS